jgi:phosphoglycolate phosphatase
MRSDGDASIPRHATRCSGRYRAFVFDLDGTLVDSRPAIEKAAQMAIAQIVPIYRDRKVTAAIGPPIRQMFKEVFSELDAATLELVVAAFRTAYDSDVCRETPSYPGVPELLARIAARGVVSFVLTNKPFAPTRQILSQLGVERHIREIVAPDSPAHPFTSKTEALDALLQRHKLARDLTVMVGDAKDDAAAAKACGVAFAAAIYGYGGLQPEPGRTNWLIINRPLDMLSLLE